MRTEYAHLLRHCGSWTEIFSRDNLAYKLLHSLCAIGVRRSPRGEAKQINVNQMLLGTDGVELASYPSSASVPGDTSHRTRTRTGYSSVPIVAMYRWKNRAAGIECRGSMRQSTR
jgi:hypothetical protein